jgi:hypothetical protein
MRFGSVGVDHKFSHRDNGSPDLAPCTESRLRAPSQFLIPYQIVTMQASDDNWILRYSNVLGYLICHE